MSECSLVPTSIKAGPCSDGIDVVSDCLKEAVTLRGRIVEVFTLGRHRGIIGKLPHMFNLEELSLCEALCDMLVETHIVIATRVVKATKNCPSASTTDTIGNNCTIPLQSLRVTDWLEVMPAAISDVQVFVGMSVGPSRCFVTKALPWCIAFNRFAWMGHAWAVAVGRTREHPELHHCRSCVQSRDLVAAMSIGKACSSSPVEMVALD